TDRFFFAGFLPSAKGQRRGYLAEISDVPGTLAFYESPKRLVASLSDMARVLGPDRPAAVCRELTKKFEEVARGTLTELATQFSERSIKGEIVVLVDRQRKAAMTEEDVETALKKALETLSVKDAASMVAEAYDLPRRDIYQAALKLSD
ncbi:MAG: SAM-dependent methyltransferase, partial [Pseudoruegeria sp.]